MSLEKNVEIKCPKCGNAIETLIWDSVNVTLDRELKNQILDGSFGMVTCPSCGEKTRLNYPFLYHDMEQKLMIQLVYDDEAAKNAVEEFKGFQGKTLPGASMDDYRFRVVNGIYALKDKIEIFDAGLDDREIEMYKLLTLPTIQGQLQGAEKIEQYFYKASDGNKIAIIADGRVAGEVGLSDDFMEVIRKQYGFSDVDEMIIDRIWALGFLSEGKR